MPGPLPNPQARRRNAPTIPREVLSPSGRTGRPPNCPYNLGQAGQKWWSWAWGTPQAQMWNKGDHYALGRRAMLEDDLAAVESFEKPDLAELLQMVEQDAQEKLEWLIGRLQARAGGVAAIMREQRELDNKFGLNPKAMADLRWTIGEEKAAADAEPPAGVTDFAAYRDRVA